MGCLVAPHSEGYHNLKSGPPNLDGHGVPLNNGDVSAPSSSPALSALFLGRWVSNGASDGWSIHATRIGLSPEWPPGGRPCRPDGWTMLGGSTRGIAVSSRIDFGCSCLAIATPGCSDALNAGPLQYVDSRCPDAGPGGQAHLADKPRLQAAVRQGARRALRPAPGDPGPQGVPCPMAASTSPITSWGRGANAEIERIPGQAGRSGPQAAGGGYASSAQLPALSRVSGPATADLAVPLPDTPRLSHGDLQVHLDPHRRLPHRNDLPRTITYGLHGTSMPAFEPLLTATDRGSHRLRDVPDHAGQDRASSSAGGQLDEKKPEELKEEDRRSSVKAYSTSGSGRRTRSSIRRSPDEPTRRASSAAATCSLASDCKDLPRPTGRGDGESFVKQDIFNDVVFGGNPSERR